MWREPQLRTTRILMVIFACLIVTAAVVLVPELAHADVKGSLDSLRSKLVGVILPVLAVISIAWAAFSLMTGNERAKTHIWYAIIGTAIAFGAQSLVDFISQTVR
jgi:type IV secretory pathway VirB2 component (pilin)